MIWVEIHLFLLVKGRYLDSMEVERWNGGMVE